MDGRVSSPYKTDVPFIKCICPKCRCIHKIQMRWIGGSMMPRKYCENCKPEIRRLSGALPDHEYPKTGE